MDMAKKSEDTIEIAFDWIVRSSADDFQAWEQERMDAWLDQDIEHRTAFELAQLTWMKIEEAPKSAFENPWFEPPDTMNIATGSPVQQVFGSLLGAGGLIAAGIAAAATVLLFVQSGTEIVPEPDLYITSVGETSEIFLDDGSSVVLGADSQISVSYSADARRISLARGEALFEVAPDIDRPFSVSGGWVDVTVTGTSFEVSRTAFSTAIAVKEGTIAVSPRIVAGSVDGLERQIMMTAGQQISATNSGTSAITNIDIESIGSWRDGQLIYVSASLTEILSDADRYYAGGIQIMDPKIQSLSLSLIHDADDTEGLLEFLEQALPIRTSRLSDGTIVVTGEL